MNEESLNQETNIEQQSTVGIENIPSDERVEPEKVDWVQRAIEYEATPKSLREPKTTQEFMKQLGVANSSYYDAISKTENQEKIIKLCFKQAKRRTPDILERLGEKAEGGDTSSIGQFMEYVLEVKKKLELSGDKDAPISISISEAVALKNNLNDITSEPKHSSE